jgi:hypothetical protein
MLWARCRGCAGASASLGVTLLASCDLRMMYRAGALAQHEWWLRKKMTVRYQRGPGGKLHPALARIASSGPRQASFNDSPDGNGEHGNAIQPLHAEQGVDEKPRRGQQRLDERRAALVISPAMAADPRQKPGRCSSTKPPEHHPAVACCCDSARSWREALLVLEGM